MNTPRRIFYWLCMRAGRVPGVRPPARRVWFEVEDPAIRDKVFIDRAYEALNELVSEYRAHPRYFDAISGHWVASNGIVIRWTAARVKFEHFRR